VDADAAITIRGDSMIPAYQDGDVVYIKCRPDVPEGAVAVVFLDNEATLKHVYYRKSGLTLISDNPAYPPIMAEFEDYDGKITIFGVPVGFTRIYKPDPLKKVKKGF
jgi:repressor LexA